MGPAESESVAECVPLTARCINDHGAKMQATAVCLPVVLLLNRAARVMLTNRLNLHSTCRRRIQPVLVPMAAGLVTNSEAQSQSLVGMEPRLAAAAQQAAAAAQQASLAAQQSTAALDQCFGLKSFLDAAVVPRLGVAEAAAAQAVEAASHARLLAAEAAPLAALQQLAAQVKVSADTYVCLIRCFLYLSADTILGQAIVVVSRSPTLIDTISALPALNQRCIFIVRPQATEVLQAQLGSTVSALRLQLVALTKHVARSAAKAPAAAKAPPRSPFEAAAQTAPPFPTTEPSTTTAAATATAAAEQPVKGAAAASGAAVAVPTDPIAALRHAIISSREESGVTPGRSRGKTPTRPAAEPAQSSSTSEGACHSASSSSSDPLSVLGQVRHWGRM